MQCELSVVCMNECYTINEKKIEKCRPKCIIAVKRTVFLLHSKILEVFRENKVLHPIKFIILLKFNRFLPGKIQTISGRFSMLEIFHRQRVRIYFMLK